jgi:hypothetical protein
MGRLTSRHGHTSCRSIFIFDINDLMIDNIISAFINASTIRTSLECLGDILNIKYIGI